MPKVRRRLAPKTIPVLMVFLLVVALPALSQSSANYDLSWHVVAGGGGRIESAAYRLQATIGQADAEWMASDHYRLAGGFWAGGVLGSEVYSVYVPLVLNRFR
jgi:hypothetical protein